MDPTIAFAIRNKLPSFTLSISWDSKNNKKILRCPKEWTSITTAVIKKNHNGFALITGITFWVLDFDNCWNTIPIETRDILWNQCSSIVKTRQGYHLYFSYNSDVKINSKTSITLNNIKYDAIDVRGINGCIIAPPSFYESDIVYRYEWVKGSLDTMQPVTPDIWNMVSNNFMIEKPLKLSSNDASWADIIDAVNMLSAERASSYNDWIAVIWALKNTETSERSLQLAQSFSQRTLKMSQYNPREVCTIFYKGKDGYTRSSIFYWAMKDSPSEYYIRFGMNELEKHVFHGDSGLAELYALENRTRVICTSQQNSTQEFYIFDTSVQLWKQSTGNDIKRHFSLTMEGIMLPLHKYYSNHINSSKDNDAERLWVTKRYELAKVMRHTHNNACAKNVLPYISSVLYNPDFYSILNKTKNLLSVANGVVNLQTGELIERQSLHYFSYALNISYNPHAKLDIWTSYFKQVFQNDQEIIDWLQTYLGYTLTGETNLQRIVVLWGSGGNSKSVLLGFLRDILEKHLFHTFSIDDLYEKEGNRDSLYDARTARIAIVNETRDKTKFDEELIKSMSGQDAITVSAKYKNSITYEAQFKFYIITNNQPQFDPEKEAIWRRIILVPFLTKFKDIHSDEWDNKLATEGKMFPKDDVFIKLLRDNLDGLLVWLIKGSIKYYNSPEKIPAKLQDIVKEYKHSCNIYLQWIQENYVKGSSDQDFVKSESLLDEWRKDHLRDRDTDKSINMKLANACKLWNVDKTRRTLEGMKVHVYLIKKKEEE